MTASKAINISFYTAQSRATCPVCNKDYNPGAKLAFDEELVRYGHVECVVPRITKSDAGQEITRSPEALSNSGASVNANPNSTLGQLDRHTSTAAPYIGETMTNENSANAEKPTDKQKEWLAKKGVPAAEVANMTKADATKKLDELFGNPSGSQQVQFPQEPVKVLGELSELFQVSDKIREHILQTKAYANLTEIGQMKTWEVLLNNYTKSRITEGISSNNRRGRR